MSCHPGEIPQPQRMDSGDTKAQRPTPFNQFPHSGLFPALPQSSWPQATKDVVEEDVGHLRRGAPQPQRTTPSLGSPPG